MHPTNSSPRSRMPKELKAKWLAALRSGKYTQGTHRLYNPANKSFCCLGVLEHVALDGLVEIHPAYDHSKFLSYPSPKFLRKFKCELPLLQLASMNDAIDGTTRPSERHFKAIADWIEEHINGV